MPWYAWPRNTGLFGNKLRNPDPRPIASVTLDIDKTKTEIVELMQNGREHYGMQTFDQHLMDLVGEGMVSYDTAIEMASSPSDFELHMKTLREDAGEVVTVTADDEMVTGANRF